MIVTKQQFLEVHLEEQQQPFWLAALANSLTGYFGSAQYRFVARSSDDDVRVLGAPFPLLHFLDPDNEDDPFGALAIARERLDELQTQLVADGWTPTGRSGQHWWSRTYARRPRLSQAPQSGTSAG